MLPLEPITFGFEPVIVPTPVIFPPVVVNAPTLTDEPLKVVPVTFVQVKSTVAILPYWFKVYGLFLVSHASQVVPD